MYIFEIAGMVVCFICVYFIGKGAEEEDAATDSTADVSQNMYVFGIFLMVAMSWVYASNAILNRALKDFHYVIIMIYHGMLGVFLSILAIAIMSLFGHEVTFFSYTGDIYFKLLCAVACDTIGVNAVTVAY